MPFNPALRHWVTTGPQYVCRLAGFAITIIIIVININVAASIKAPGIIFEDRILVDLISSYKTYVVGSFKNRLNEAILK